MAFDPLQELPAYFPEPFPYLETERLILRENSPNVVNKVFGNYSDAAIMAFYDLPDESALEKERENLKKGYETVNISFCNWVMFNKATGIVVGHIGYHTWQPRFARAEIGFALSDNKFEGQGFATEALWAVLAHGFDSMDINRIEAYVHPENQRSIRLLKRTGFVLEATLHEHVLRNDEKEDSLLFRLLKKDFLPR